MDGMSENLVCVWRRVYSLHVSDFGKFGLWCHMVLTKESSWAIPWKLIDVYNFETELSNPNSLYNFLSAWHAEEVYPILCVLANLSLASVHASMFLGVGRKPDNPQETEKIHTDMGNSQDLPRNVKSFFPLQQDKGQTEMIRLFRNVFNSLSWLLRAHTHLIPCGMARWF